MSAEIPGQLSRSEVAAAKRFDKLHARYTTDEYFAALVDKLQQGLNQTGLTISDARAAVWYLQRTHSY